MEQRILWTIAEVPFMLGQVYFYVTVNYKDWFIPFSMYCKLSCLKSPFHMTAFLDLIYPQKIVFHIFKFCKKILLTSQKYLQISILIYPQVRQSDFYIPHLTHTWKWWNHLLTTFSLKCLASWSEQQYRRENKSIKKIQVKKK